MKAIHYSNFIEGKGWQDPPICGTKLKGDINVHDEESPITCKKCLKKLKIKNNAQTRH